MKKRVEESLWKHEVCFKCNPKWMDVYQSEAKHLGKDESWMWLRIKADWKFAMVWCEHFEEPTCPYLLEHIV